GEKTVELTVWVYDYLASDDSSPLVQAKQVFEDANPNIKINFQPTVYGSASYRDKFITQVHGGAGPDVIVSDVVWVPQLASMGAILPITDKAQGVVDQFHEGPLKTVTYNGELY